MILIVASKFDKSEEDVIEHLISGAEKILKKNNRHYKVLRVAGANEIPLTVQHFLTTRGEKFEGAIALGCVIKGDTDHYEMVVKSVTEGLSQVALSTGKPVIQGVLCCRTKEQACERKNLGEEYGQTTIEMVDLLK